MSKKRTEIWFRPTTIIKGFSAVHWKGPLLVTSLGLCFAVTTVVAIVTSEHHVIISTLAAWGALAILIGGHVIVARHTEGD
jgi:hypothetical protein